MNELQKKTDDELVEGISASLRIAIVEGEHWNSWYRQMRVDYAIAYQNEQKRRQTERFIGVVEELTDVIRRKKLSDLKELLAREKK